MTDNIPVHLRITGLQPSNEDVDSIRAAVAALAASWGRIKDINSIVTKAAAIAESLGGDGTPSAEFGTEVQTVVQKRASAFLYTERPLEIGICAGMAAVTMMKPEPSNNGWTILDLYSNALWSALAFQPVLGDDKRESLRREVLDRALQRSLDSAEKARDRDNVAEPGDLEITIVEGTATTNFKKAALDVIAALRRNAVLDREEIDFLWWSQLNRSQLLNRPFAKISEATRLVASGIEASRLLRRFPAEVQRDLVLRTMDADPEIDLVELIAEIGEDRTALVSGIQAKQVTDYPTVFPLLNAVVTGVVEFEGAKVKRKASTWGGRALLEGALSRLMATGMPGK